MKTLALKFRRHIFPSENTFAASCSKTTKNSPSGLTQAPLRRVRSEGVFCWSALRGSNSRHSAWEADTLPTELNAHKCLIILFYTIFVVNKSRRHDDARIVAELDQIVTHLVAEDDLTGLILQLIRSPELLLREIRPCKNI